jgi:hypothetical protein
MSTAELDQSFIVNATEPESAPLSGADFLYPDNVGSVRDFLLDKTSSSEKSFNYGNIFRLQEHLKGLVGSEKDNYDRSTLLSHYAAAYRGALDIPHNQLTVGERSTKVTSGLFLSNVAALSELRVFIIDRFWTPKTASNDSSKKRYLERRKVYQEDIDTYYDYFRDDMTVAQLDGNLLDIANAARLLVSRQEWAGAITDSNNHEFVGSVLSERVVKQSLRNAYPETRYGTAEEDASPTKADVVVPLGRSALHLQVKMRINEAEFTVHPDRTPMGVVVPMQTLRSQLTKPEHRQLLREVSKKAEDIAA